MQDSQEHREYTTTRLPDMIPVVRQRLEALREEPGPDPLQPLKDLFWTDLNYAYVNRPLPVLDWSPAMRDTLEETPFRLATAGKDNDFDIFYFRLKGERLSLTKERPIVIKLLEEQLDGLFIFSNATQNRWHFVNVKQDSAQSRRRLFRRITIGPEERLRTASERIALLDLSMREDDSRFAISQLHEKAFDVEAVTDKFFQEYRNLFRILQKDLTVQTGDETWAHDYALQFLNRCMFLFFLQRKGWLGDDKEFLHSFWTAYKTPEPEYRDAVEYQTDTFFEYWLQVLFFKAFNNNKHLMYSRSHFPAHINQILTQAPYLNGGLFTENDLDKRSGFRITDGRFQQILTFLESYNFTIAEDSPLDQEVAVDPEMIGKVYESLVNVTTEQDERGAAGIFYTPRVEIDLMCRLSLVDYLASQLGQEYRNLLYGVVFALEPHEKSEADDKIVDKGLWAQLQSCLRSVRVIDPACGSGSFLVGMLYVLDDLQKRANEQEYNENTYKRKKRIIEQSLYGVDAKNWAVHIAELRLWLTLIVEDIPDDPGISTVEGRYLRTDPILPHLSFKVRQGDSLVQMVGNINMGLNTTRHLPSELRERLNRLVKDKRDLFHGEPSRHPKTREQIIQDEFTLFCAILDAQIHKHREESKKYQRAIEVLEGERSLFDGKPTSTLEAKTKLEHLRQQKARVDREVEKLREARTKLKTPKDEPFVWDIAFSEVFGEDQEHRGFSIVIGNPPYVRQEHIADPQKPREEATIDRNKQEYKAQLAHAVYQAYPHFFGYNGENAVRKIDGKSDLYIYFYLLGLRLLQPKGSFCFITSNSWLDVGYGKDLQEFLLRYCRINMILDNQVKRSFISADVNTIIALFSAPSEKSDEHILHHLARFVMFKVPFEDTLSADVFKEIERQDERSDNEVYRIHTIPQQTLLEEGYAENEEEATADTSRYKTGKASAALFERRGGYAVNKWGGKYLRAPDIYWTILEKGRGKLARLGDIADVRRGVTTGANEFFYLDEAKAKQWHIEEEFLRPVIKSPRECKSILIDPRELKFKLFMCHKTKEELKGTAALEYVEWGESQEYDRRPSCRGRARWWDLGERNLPLLGFNYLIDTTAKTLYAPDGCYFSDNFQEIIISNHSVLSLCASLNSTIFQLMVNVAGRSNFGGGLLKIQTYEVSDLLCLNPATLVFNDTQLLTSTSWDVLHPSAERQVLDSFIFDVLHLTRGEQDEIYKEVEELVETRLEKAKSLKTNKRINRALEAVYNTVGIWMGIPEEIEEEVDSPYA